MERLPFGIKRLDEALGGGLDRETITLIAGRSGSGKTILASQWAAEGVKTGDTIVYISTTFTEKSCRSYIGKMKFMDGLFDSINWRFVRIDAKYFLPMTREKLNESSLKTIGMPLENIDRLIFDTITDLDKALHDPVLFRMALRYFAEMCHDNGITAIFIEEAPMISEWSETKNLAETIIFTDILKIPEEYARGLRILKKYRHSHPLGYIPFEITENGIETKEGWYVRKDYEFVYKK